ncbi:MAG TPA: hypothetical protein VNW29_06940 [Candidatus Sulfotelmatobacter sp.]|jgi:hypothetical protein|nr:hypothetical protein [Candidatus Sulfotelmatobacter sp.]
MTIERARKILGKRAEKLTDEEIQKILNLLILIANKAIDETVK